MAKFFRRSKKKTDIKPTKIALPPKFAERVLQYEMDLEYECTIEAVQKLMQMYSEAIEYYESIGDNRFIQYQERMMSMWVRQDVITAMKGEGPKKQAGKPKREDLIRKKEEANNSRQRRARILNESRSEAQVERHAQNLVNQTSESTMNSSFTVRKDRTSQEVSLESRLSARIRQRSTSPTVKFSSRFRRRSVLEPESSAGAPKTQKYEEELEKVVEKFLMKKNSRVVSIKETYEPQIEELRKKGGTDFESQIAMQMETEMNEEIEKVTVQIAEQKKKKIEKLRNQFLC